MAKTKHSSFNTVELITLAIVGLLGIGSLLSLYTSLTLRLNKFLLDTLNITILNLFYYSLIFLGILMVLSLYKKYFVTK